MAEQRIVQRVAVKAVIVNHEGKILVVREASTYEDSTNRGPYGMPGGRLDPGEHFQDGLRREVMEETGLAVEIGKPLHVGEWSPVIKGTPTQIIAIFFDCRPLDTEVRLSRDHDDYAWIAPKDTSRYPLMSPEDYIIENYRQLAT